MPRSAAEDRGNTEHRDCCQTIQLTWANNDNVRFAHIKAAALVSK
jgi:hypothetical protein